MDARPERGEGLDEGVVLALRDCEVDGVQEAMRRVVERRPERRPGPLDEHVPQRGGHALGAEAPVGGDHRQQDSRRLGRWSALPRRAAPRHHRPMQTPIALRRRLTGLVATAVLLLTLGSSGASAATSVVLTPVVSGLDAPVYVIGPTTDRGDCSSSSRPGKIMIVKNGAVLPTPFLDISDLVSNGSEQGLLGLAFHPKLQATNGLFYVDYTSVDGDTQIVQFGTGRRRTRTSPLRSTAQPDPADRPAVLQPQRRDARIRTGQLPVHRDGRWRQRR